MESNDCTKILKNSEHFKNIWRTGRVAIVYSGSSGLATEIHSHISKEGLECELIDSENPSWFQISSGRCNHYLFLSQPESICRHKRAEVRSAEYAYFSDCSITTAVFIVEKFPPKRKTDVLAERFLKLEKQGHDSGWLATAAVVMFSVPCPLPFPDDGAYWSSEPKLITVLKKTPEASLGFSIMTRLMGPDSVFNKVILVKRFTETSIESKIGKFGHIQSINGELLDGLDIDKATQFFRDGQHTYVQLVVRFIHPVRPAETTPTHNGPRPATLNVGKAEETSSAPVATEPMPLPLFIFGDNNTVCRNLASFLSAPEQELSSTFATNLATPSSVSSTTCLVSMNSPRGSEDGDRLPTLGAKEGVTQWPFGSDECMDRQEASHSYFEGQGEGVLDAGDGTAPRQQPTSVSGFRFVVQTLKDASSKRSFAHLFMKPVGLYLVALDLEDVAFDPLIQYENMLYWLSLIHMYVRPSTLERVFIVGMCKRSELEEGAEHKIGPCLELFNRALEKSSYLSQIYHFTDSSSREKKTFVFEFDQDKPQSSTKQLCGHISDCLRILTQRAPNFEAEFSKVMFHPSPHFHPVCTKLMSTAKPRSFVPDLSTIINSYPHPDRAHLVHTLAAYAPIWIDDDCKACLVGLHIIVELVRSFMQVEDAGRVFKDELTFRYHLPILNYPFVKKKIMERGLKDEAELVRLLACMKKFHFLFSIGSSAVELNKQKFLVPYLAMEECAEQGIFQQWDLPYVSKNFSSPTCTTLYAELQFAATHQFFHSVLALLLAQLPAHSPAGHDYHTLIKLGCKQAVLCLNHEEVLLKYHPIQNIIEFRLPASAKMREHGLFKGVNSCLITAYTSLLPAPQEDKFPIVYCIPVAQQEASSTPLHQLKESSGEEAAGPEEDAADGLLCFKYLDVQASKSIDDAIFKNNPQLRAWASSHPEAKELPADLFEEVSKELSGSDAWKTLAIELGVLETKDVNLWTHNPHKYGNGHIVMSKWKDSGCTWQRLVAALGKIGHTRLAGKVENACKNEY